MIANSQSTTTRRPMDAEDYLDALRRRRTWLFAPLLASLAVSGTGSYLWPETYQSLKNLKDVRSYSSFTVLSSIPEIENDLVIRRRQRLEFLGWTASLTLGILLMAGAIGYYYATRI